MCADCKPDNFPKSDDLGGELPAQSPAYKAPTAFTTAPQNEGEFVETCKACRGSGRFTRGFRDYGPCFKCKGKGKITFKTSPEQRATRAKQAEESKVRKAAELAAEVDAYHAANPAVVEWIKRNPNFAFAQSMSQAIRQYGSLTDNQFAAVQKCIQRDADRVAERTAREASAPEIMVSNIEEAFAKAKAAGLKKIYLNLGEFKFKPAGVSSKNYGSVYVTSGEEYLGRITAGRFVAVKTCSDERAAAIIAAAADPKAAAIAHGKLTGSCAICGRELTNPESVELGIGPICAARFGW